MSGKLRGMHQRKMRVLAGESAEYGETVLVPRVGIEPTLLAERDFESRASTNFATEAGVA